jgi:hypothetical protein
MHVIVDHAQINFGEVRARYRAREREQAFFVRAFV